MTMQQLTLPGTLVKKHNELVRNKVNITCAQGARVLAHLLTCIKSTDSEFKDTYKISAKDLLPVLGGGSYKQIQGICKKLIKSFVEIEMIYPNGEKEFVLYSFFSSLKYKKGIIEARFNPDMNSFLLELKRNYTQYNIIEYSSLSSIYSQRLYEFLKSWASVQERVVELTELHKILLVPESAISHFGEFRRNILEKSKKEIFKKTNFFFEFEIIKRSRAVVAIRFIFAKNRALPVTAVKENKIKMNTNKSNIKNFNIALVCAEGKNGLCLDQDNKKSVCTMCVKLKFCDEILKTK